jgi:hypothetical protein
MLAEQFGGYGAPTPVAERPGEPSAGEDCTAKVGPDQPASAQIGPRQVGPAQIGLAQIGTPEKGLC